MGVRYYQDPDDFCEEHPEVVILATSILSMEAVLAGLPVQRLKRNTLFVDVLSVKEFPKRLMLEVLPEQVRLDEGLALVGRGWWGVAGGCHRICLGGVLASQRGGTARRSWGARCMVFCLRLCRLAWELSFGAAVRGPLFPV